jgi:hypothetical protein
LNGQSFSSNLFQTLPLHMVQTQIWQSKHVVNHIWNIERHLYRCLDCHGIYFYLHPTFFSSTEQCTWAIISPKEFKSWVSMYLFIDLIDMLLIWFLIVGKIFRLETCMNSLVKVPPYSKLNFQGKNVFTQNWCNIT